MLINKHFQLPKQKYFRKDFLGEWTSINNKQYHKVSGMGNPKKTLTLSEISETISHLILGGRWETAISSYESTRQSGLAVEVGNELIHFNAIWILFKNF